MKCLFRYIFSSVLLLCLTAAFAEPINQFVVGVADTTVKAEPDRLADDFVKVSLIVIAPGKALYSQMGHACFRMQCPYYGLDYCLSYESEDVADKVQTFLLGKLKAAVQAFPTNTYLGFCSEEQRAVYEYELHLPPQVEAELWRILDEQVIQGTTEHYDYINKGCAIICTHSLMQAIKAAGFKVEFDMIEPLNNINKWTKAELMYYSKPEDWGQFFVGTICGDQGSPLYDPHAPFTEKLIIPRDLALALQNAHINNDSLTIISHEKSIVGYEKKKAKITPFAVFLFVLLLSVTNLFFQNPIMYWIVVATQVIIGLLLTYLVFFSALPATNWNILLIPFNPLPAIFWNWRRYWVMPYAVITSLWSISVALLSLKHLLVTPEYLVLSLAVAVTYISISFNVNTKYC